MTENAYERFNSQLNSLPLERLQAESVKEVEQAEEDFQAFRAALAEGRCSLCGMPVTHFSERKPCLHWLLKPKGFKKKHFPLLFPIAGFHRMNGYLRWVAKSAVALQNINDLAEDRSATKLIEETVRYKNREWSFSCSHGDRAGHQDRTMGRDPHFHLQMKVDGHVVIRYNDLYIPFDDYDEFCFAMKESRIDRLKSGFGLGRDAGMQAMFEMIPPEQLVDQIRSSDSEDDAAFDMSTMIFANEGTALSGTDIAAMYEERKRTGTPIAKLAQ